MVIEGFIYFYGDGYIVCVLYNFFCMKREGYDSLFVCFECRDWSILIINLEFVDQYVNRFLGRVGLIVSEILVEKLYVCKHVYKD